MPIMGLPYFTKERKFGFYVIDFIFTLDSRVHGKVDQKSGPV